MPWGLERYQQSGQSHFVTFCCYHRQPRFNVPEPNRTFEFAVERVRRSYDLCIYGYVVMPEHVHLLFSEPEQKTLAEALKSLKQGVARRLPRGDQHFWQKRYYDFNVRNHGQFMQKLHYIHCNPVRRGLCETPDDWEWSSFRHYATGTEGIVEIESEWTAIKRERAADRMCPAVVLAHTSLLLACVGKALTSDWQADSHRESKVLKMLKVLK